jgi:hypothetical protein
VRYQEDFTGEMNSALDELEDLEFLYAYDRQREEYTLKEEEKFEEDEKMRKEVVDILQGRG